MVRKTNARQGTCIDVEDAWVHNLKGLNIQIPHGQWLAVCGPSGSGKTSLALDTLYAEGQRRYIESFSAYTRQFLNAMEKPNAREINGIPPAIAVTRARRSMTGRATVGSTTETLDYLREVFSKLAEPVCEKCQITAHRHSGPEIAERLSQLPDNVRLILGFSWVGPRATLEKVARHLLLAGFSRASLEGESVELAQVAAGDGSQTAEEVEADYGQLPLTLALEDLGWQSAIHPEALLERFPVGPISLAARVQEDPATKRPRKKTKSRKRPGKRATVSYASDDGHGPNVVLDVIVDRVVTGSTAQQRIGESLETALQFGHRTFVWAEVNDAISLETWEAPGVPPAQHRRCAGRDGWRWNFSQMLECSGCNQEFPFPTPALFSYNSPAGACPTCEGFGSVSLPDIQLIVPDPRKTIRQGAIAPWFTPKYKVKLRQLLQIAEEIGLDVDKPFSQLSEDELKLVWDGATGTRFHGLNGFFRWLEKKKYKMHHRIFMARWRSYFDCPDCEGKRLKPTSLQYRISGQSIANICDLQVSEALDWFDQLDLDQSQQSAVRTVLPQVVGRLNFLKQVGLSYVTLARTLRTLSGGELQRTSLTTALGSSLVNMLYVLDEPSVGLHPRDIQRLTDSIASLNRGGNTVVTVEHEPSMLVAADRIVEIGPGAGARGGEIVFDGSFAELKKSKTAQTSAFVQHLGVKGQPLKPKEGKPDLPRRKPGSWLELKGARGHNLKEVSVKIPTNVLCLVTGVSGSGKSTLIRRTLFPAIAARLADDIYNGLPYDKLKLPKSVQEVVLIDDSPIGRSPRSNPVTYVKAFAPIRKLFSETYDAKSRNLTAGSFSFNVDGGRCTQCQGDGTLTIDMQFMPDVFMQCPECQGTRYQKEVLEVTVRDRNIHEVLQMTVREAFQFFRGETPILSKLQPLLDVGLDYIQLGQGAPTLSAGESQRLKLASFLGTQRKKPTLFIMDEPTTGLHPTDILKLIECFGALLDVGHSLVIVEHNTQLMAAADYLIDLGPEAADQGGEVVAVGTPEEVVRQENSLTGQFLAADLAAFAPD